MNNGEFEKAYTIWHPKKKSAESKKKFLQLARGLKGLLDFNIAIKKVIPSVNEITVVSVEKLNNDQYQVNYNKVMPGKEMFQLVNEEAAKLLKDVKNPDKKQISKALNQAAANAAAKLKKMPTQSDDKQAIIIAIHKGRFYFFDQIIRKQ